MLKTIGTLSYRLFILFIQIIIHVRHSLVFAWRSTCYSKLTKIEIKFGRVEVTLIGFFFIFPSTYSILKNIKSVKLKIKFISPYWMYLKFVHLLLEKKEKILIIHASWLQQFSSLSDHLPKHFGGGLDQLPFARQIVVLDIPTNFVPRRQLKWN